MLVGVSCPSASLCVAASDTSLLSTVTPTDPGSWSTATILGGSSQLQGEFTGVACGSNASCVAVDSETFVYGTDPSGYPLTAARGAAYATGDPTGPAGSWTRTIVAPIAGLAAVACPTDSKCVGIDGGGAVPLTLSAGGTAAAGPPLSIDGYVGLDGVSCATSRLCVAIDDAGRALASTVPDGGASTWHPVGAPAFNGRKVWLDGVVCGPRRTCLATGFLPDDTGVIERSVDGGAAWRPVATDPGLLGQLACPSRSFCWAADDSDNLLVSTDRRGDFRRWRRESLKNDVQLVTATCPSQVLCIGIPYTNGEPARRLLYVTRPGRAGSRQTLRRVERSADLLSVACATSSLCVAGDSRGGILSSADAAAAHPRWRRRELDPGRLLTLVSCPGRSFCVAADGAGNVLASADPAAPHPHWSFAHVGTPRSPIEHLACAGESLCIAAPDPSAADLLFGTITIFASSDPAAGIPTWSAAGTSHLLEGLSCPSAELCVAVDTLGEALTGGPQH